MGYYLFKIAVSALIIVMVSEVAKRSSLLGGLLASLPLISYLAMIWLYIDSRDAGKVAALSWSILWLVLPSLSLFVALPLLLKKLPFVPSLALATVIMFATYGLTLLTLRRLGVTF